MIKMTLQFWPRGLARMLCMALVLLQSAALFAQTPAAKPGPSEQDIIENLRMETPDGPWWYWWLIASSVLVMLVPLFFVFRRLYRKKMLPFQAQPVPPETSALERLSAIRHLIDEGAVRDFVRESSDILRSYIEARFGLRAPRLSTEEFLYEAEHSPHLDAAHRAKLAEFLFRCDRVKFGLGDLDAARMESLYSAAEDFIRTTGSSVAAATAAAASPAASSYTAPTAAPSAPARTIKPSQPPSATPVESEEGKAEAEAGKSEPAKTEVAG